MKIKVYVESVSKTNISFMCPYTPPRAGEYYMVEPERWLILNIFYNISWKSVEVRA